MSVKKNTGFPDRIKRRSLLGGTAGLVGLGAANLVAGRTTAGQSEQALLASQGTGISANRPAVKEIIKIT